MGQSLWQVFGDTVRRHGDRTAVEIFRRDIVDGFTYRELHALALERAAFLRRAGVARGDRCAILADNHPRWCAAYLGILAVGGVAVPLDTNYSAAQVRTIVNDCGAKVLFTNTRLRAVAEEAVGGAMTIAPVEPAEPAELAEPTEPAEPAEPVEPAEPFEPALILYTSGTTSDPKGVVLTHANLLAERDAAFAVVDVTSDDVILGVLPLFHALAQLANLLLPFAVGARVTYLETVNSTELIRALQERGVSIFACVPQFFYLIHQRVTDQVKKGGAPARAAFGVLKETSFALRRVGVNIGPLVFGKVHRVLGPRMRLLVTGGSKFDPAIGRDLYAMGFTILQAYGLTETSAAATINTRDEAHIDTVGRPLPGVEVKILPPESADVDGEIAIRGPIVMQGYFKRPDATAEVMRDGWFLTGDLGRVDESGRVTITGRKKEVIVLASGKNIHPEEIEAHYRGSPFIKEICVLGLADADRPMTERLHAVVVPNMELLKERKVVNTGDIIRFEMEGRSVGLPAHKHVLGYDIWFEPLPKTTTGKLKRHEVERRLKEQRRAAAAVAGGAVALSDADRAWLDEPQAADVVRAVEGRVHGRVTVRPDANLELDLGLDSMERVELLTELEQRFGVAVPREVSHEVFTVRQLVDALKNAEAGTTAQKSVQGDGNWDVILRDLPPATDPVLSGLLEAKPLSTPLLFLLSRVVRLALGRVRVSGLEHLPADGAFLICPNHQSFLDPLFVCGVLPHRVFKRMFFVGAVEYFETPFTRWVARTVNCVPVDPDSNLVPAMKAGAFGLSHGKVLVLFPEGERSVDGTVKKFKKGAPILAEHLHVPVVPVAIDGVHELWPRNRPFNWSAWWPWAGHRIRIAFGEPMKFESGETYADAASRLRDRVDGMWRRLGR